MRRYLCVCLAMCLCAGLLLGGCACAPTAPSTKDNNCLTVICTTYAAKEIAVALTSGWDDLPEGHGYDALQIQILGQAGRDIHSYEPTAADLVSLYNADLFIYVGDTAEPWVANALAAVGGDGTSVDMMTMCHDALLPMDHHEDTCSPEPGHSHDHDHDGDETYDEHVWMSLRNMMTMTAAVSQSLVQIAPHATELIRQNEQAYLAELAALDAAYTAVVEGGARREIMIADRNPFAYLMHDYGITAHAAFSGCSSETEASFATQTRLIETVETLDLPYIFQTEGGASSVASTLSSTTGADVLTLHACQVMTEEERGSVSYLEIMARNLESLKKALWTEGLSASKAK